MPHKPELLAPAGNAACALAAYDAGADAVYAGLKRFNARERTGNFTPDEMGRVIRYAHKNGRKFYVTLNTLIKESEVPEAAEMLAELDRMHPDAVIVQDLGVVAMLRDYFPRLTIHASTQTGIHNTAGLELAHELGVKRVILERQTSLAELESIAASKPPVELEVFIHGALCCCISGSCLLSSWLGGWSGNRGKCKQPCRRRYHTDKGNGFYLSVQDLCTMELLPRIAATGVASVKIEGRLRRSDYVEHAVSAYRMLLDATSEEEFKSLLPAARDRMAHTFGRKWSEGFYTAASAKTLVKHDSLGASGQLCGTIVSAKDGLAVIDVTKRIHLGDVLRIQPRSGDEGPAVSVTSLMVNGVRANRALQGERCTIRLAADTTAAPGSIVYKTGESTSDYSRRVASLPAPRPEIPLRLRLDGSGLAADLCGRMFRKPLELAPAASHPVTPESLAGAFDGEGSPDFVFSPVRAEVDGSFFLPASVLKSIRRELTAFAEGIPPQERPDPAADSLKRLLADYERIHLVPERKSGTTAVEPPASCVILPRGVRPPSSGMAVIRELADDPSPHEELLLPFYIPQKALPDVAAALDRFVQKGGKTVRVTSIQHFALLKKHPGLTIRTSFPLPCCNSFAARELGRLGASSVQAWVELERAELEAFTRKSPVPAEQFIFGRPVLLSTRAAIQVNGDMQDARGNTFRVSHHGILTQITADKVMELPRVRGFAAYLTDLRDARADEPGEALFNFGYELK
jgi:putative protease